MVNSPPSDDVGILILAGGEATRLPGKLMLDAGGVPLLTRVYLNLTSDAPGREVALGCSAANQAPFAALLPIPIIVDRSAGRGPLGGMLTAFAVMRSRRVFVAAGDAPFLDAKLVQRLAAVWQDGDECVVPQLVVAGSPTIEPLAALYDRIALLREGPEVLRSCGGGVQIAVQRLRARSVPNENPRTFTNVNTPLEYAALLHALRERTTI